MRELDAEDVARRAGPVVWVMTAKLRGHRFHGTEPCRGVDPFRATDRGAYCPDCTEIVGLVLVRLAAAWQAAGLPDDAFDPWVRRRAVNEFRETLRSEDAAAGMDAKPTQIPKSLFDEDDEELVVLMKFFVRSNDLPEGNRDFPVRRFAARLGIEPGEVADRINDLEARSANSQFGRRWWARNIEVPLARRSSRSNLFPPDELPVDQRDPVGDAVSANSDSSATNGSGGSQSEAIAIAVDLAAAGTPVAAALQKATTLVYGRDATATLATSSEFASLCALITDIVEWSRAEQ